MTSSEGRLLAGCVLENVHRSAVINADIGAAGRERTTIITVADAPREPLPPDVACIRKPSQPLNELIAAKKTLAARM
jgi:hypothetical protein